MGDLNLGGGKFGPFSEEDVCIVSKRDPCMIWTGTKILYSGSYAAGPQQKSGYNYRSGESDVEPISISGWGEIRIPELNQLHKLFVFPKPCWILANVDYTSIPAGYSASGVGGCSGKSAKVHYNDICCKSGHHGSYGEFIISSVFSCACSGSEWPTALSGYSNEFNSGLVDVIAFGSEY